MNFPQQSVNTTNSSGSSRLNHFMQLVILPGVGFATGSAAEGSLFIIFGNRMINFRRPPARSRSLHWTETAFPAGQIVCSHRIWQYLAVRQIDHSCVPIVGRKPCLLQRGPGHLPRIAAATWSAAPALALIHRRTATGSEVKLPSAGSALNRGNRIFVLADKSIVHWFRKRLAVGGPPGSSSHCEHV